MMACFTAAFWAFLRPGGPWPLGPEFLGLIERLSGTELSGRIGGLISILVEAAVFAALLAAVLLIGHFLMGKGIEELEYAEAL